MTELKPCPFCGQTARLEFHPGSMNMYWVGCTNPHCNVVVYADDKEKAIAQWNRRLTE